ncbi:MAG: peptidoglycan DD-metalloendopeptidase family protein [Bacillota bacterium]
MLHRSLVGRGGLRAAGLVLVVTMGVLGVWPIRPGGLAAVSAAAAKASTPAKSPSSPATPAPAQPGEKYVVKPGDTLYELARAYHTDVDSIKEANNLTGNTIYVGQGLAIPSAAPRLYRIKAGDTLWNIALQFGTTVAELAKANGLSNPNRLAVGAVLTVPNGTPAVAGAESKAASTAASVALPSGLRFIRPLRGAITSNYGPRDGEMHRGVDIAGSYGDDIKAAADGVVQSVGWIAGYGLAVIISHSGGYQTLYAHTQKTFVRRGAAVKQGQVIAQVGSTGRSTGPHLHFEISRNSRTMDPLPVLAP